MESVFPNKTIKEGWLSPLTLPVGYLVLISNNIREIGARAFAGHPFTDLVILEMEDLPLISLKNSSLFDTKIETLSITYTENHTFALEQQVLDGVKSTLATLNIKRCLNSAEAIVNLTGQYRNCF